MSNQKIGHRTKNFTDCVSKLRTAKDNKMTTESSVIAVIDFEAKIDHFEKNLRTVIIDPNLSDTDKLAKLKNQILSIELKFPEIKLTKIDDSVKEIFNIIAIGILEAINKRSNEIVRLITDINSIINCTNLSDRLKLMTIGNLLQMNKSKY
jgi:hypothetical protein